MAFHQTSSFGVLTHATHRTQIQFPQISFSRRNHDSSHVRWQVWFILQIYQMVAQSTLPKLYVKSRIGMRSFAYRFYF